MYYKIDVAVHRFLIRPEPSNLHLWGGEPSKKVDTIFLTT
ncbi:hypothetical protein LEP1GSC199_1438 [Leptospira vanthielii serovar Holland str. Waz Holland = ATCC 700522]|uniref:Uncharacterized protein n=1 Tax=Leptospira vanthielii serovar Holland str. Waz Holland = ATCC 700522 TaxID=1218591 RepID=N1W544_9LEPT|nr:hypothetical protein LEP1GSC199_1438 [Leptospira vanthielii serovar Holland str. Waz Holland = ATCC 700522]